MSDFEVFTSTISRITYAIASEVIACQNRPLDELYLIVWMHGIVFKVRENFKVINKTIDLAVCLNREIYKEILGMWLGKNVSSTFWMSVLTDLKVRGVEDILITATDNLNGFTQSITSIFPQTNIQIRVVHQIREACNYVVWKDRKEFTSDMNLIYNAPNREMAAFELDRFSEKWNHKCPYAVQSWRNNDLI